MLHSIVTRPETPESKEELFEVRLGDTIRMLNPWELSKLISQSEAEMRDYLTDHPERPVI